MTTFHFALLSMHLWADGGGSSVHLLVFTMTKVLAVMLEMIHVLFFMI